MAALGNFAAVSSVAAVGPVKLDVITFTGATYATGGTTGLKAGVRGLSKDNRQPKVVIGLDCGDAVLAYDEATDKLKVTVMSTGLEVANTTDLTGNTYKVLVISA